MWSAGFQLGSHGLTGPTVQRLGVLDGSVEATIGLLEGVVFSLDYVRFFDSNLKQIKFIKNNFYNQLRSKILLYTGGGIHINGGLAIRLPMGVTYCMLKDPVQFYGGLNVKFGPLVAEAPGVDLGVQFGLRILL